ncbi:MAG: ATP-binding protein [Lachnospiraceae bacterium]|nr:ATP-binding protein [Lachnospiraceae bacterium]
MEHYITDLWIDDLRHLSDIHIELNHERRTSLLLTGKNGSGKTTVLQALRAYLQAVNDERLQDLEVNYPAQMNVLKRMMQHAKNESKKDEAQKNYEHYLKIIKNYGHGLRVVFNNINGIEQSYREGKYLTAYYRSDRKTNIIKQRNVEDVMLNTSYSLDSSPGNELLKYLVHLKTQQAYARNENDMAVVQMLDEWFARFLNALRVLLDDQRIQLKYDYKNYNFQILEDGREPYGFDQLSDGYSAALQIVADLILRMEQNWLKTGKLSSYDTEGIVLIDELETHLHIGLQKTILPFLTGFFPNIQFIVSTHSPYILNSIENCVVYDLENRIRMEDMSGYPAEGIVEGYFGQESYSERLLKKVKRYEELAFLKDPTEDERTERAKLLAEMKRLSGDLAKEAKNAFEEIEDKRKHHDKI